MSDSDTKPSPEPAALDGVDLPPPGAPVKADEKIVEAVLGLVNAARAAAKAGESRPALRMSTTLCQAAQDHAEDMVRRNYFNLAPDGGGEGLDGRARRFGYGGRIGFNLARNRASAEEAVCGWMADETAMAGLLDSGHRDLGVGTISGYWVLLVGSPEDSITDALRERMLEIINEPRKRYSMPLLELNRQLNYIAQMHSLDMSSRKFFDHVNPDGKKAEQRAVEAGYTAYVFELLSEQPLPEEAFAKWNAVPAFRSELVSERYRCLGVGLFAGKWTVVLGYPPATSNAPPPKDPTELGNELFALLNEQRAAAKTVSLKSHPGLAQVVQGHAADMAAKNFLAYEHPGVPGIAARVKDSGYRGRVFPAITKGQRTADAVVKLFLGSEGHRKNILDPQFKDFAIAVKDDAWVLILGAPQAEAGFDLRADFLRLINGQRAANNAPALSQSSLLNHVAQDYAQDMARRDYFGFTNPEGKGPDALAKMDGFPGRVLPSLARGASTPEAALNAWLSSAQSRESLLSPTYSVMGIGVADSRWVLLLGTANS